MSEDRAARTADFISGLGVNTHIWGLPGSYGNAQHDDTNPAIADYLDYLGIHTVRDGVPGDGGQVTLPAMNGVASGAGYTFLARTGVCH